MTRAESQARTRSELLDAAAAVVAERGFSGAAVEEIASRAGYTTGALYSNFESKEQLFLELLSARHSRSLQQRIELLETTLASQLASGRDPFEAATELFIAIADRDWEFAPLQAEFWLYAIRHPEAMDVIATNLAQQLSGLERIVATVLEQAGVPRSVKVREVTTAVIALFHGLVRQRRVNHDQVADDLFATALRWLLSGITYLEKERPSQ